MNPLLADAAPRDRRIEQAEVLEATAAATQHPPIVAAALMTRARELRSEVDDAARLRRQLEELRSAHADLDFLVKEQLAELVTLQEQLAAAHAEAEELRARIQGVVGVT